MTRLNIGRYLGNTLYIGRNKEIDNKRDNGMICIYILFYVVYVST